MARMPTHSAQTVQTAQTTHTRRIIQTRQTRARSHTGWLASGWRAVGMRFARQPQPARILAFAVLVGLLALLYLSQVAAVTATHQTLLQEQARQSDLRRQDATLHAELGQLESPTYIEQRARALGMVPADPAAVVWIALHDAGH